MLRSPFISKGVPRPRRCHSHARAMMSEFQCLLAAPTASSSSSSDASSTLVSSEAHDVPLASWLYRAVLFRRLWRDGFVGDAIASGLSANDFTRVLRSVLTPPRSLTVRLREDSAQSRGGRFTAPRVSETDAAALLVVSAAQRAFAQCLARALRLPPCTHWTSCDRWGVATAVISLRTHPEDAASVALLLPLVCEARGDTHALPAALLCLVARCRGVAPADAVLRGAATAACAAPSDTLLDCAPQAAGDEALLRAALPRALHAPCCEALQGFAPFWRAVLGAMAAASRDALRAGSGLADRSRVAALLSVRRVIASLRRHSRVRPLLALHAAAAPGLQCGAPAAMPLATREAALLDAYALLTAGHVGEAARDTLDAGVAEGIAALQDRCLAHVEALAASEPPPGEDRDSRGLHRGARAELRERLLDALRVSCKPLLRRGAHGDIVRLMKRCPAVGASWEAVRAHVALGKPREAVSVAAQFIAETRGRFAAGLPQHIRTAALDAVAAAASSLVSLGEEGTNSSAGPSEVLALYDQTRTWGFPMPPAVTFAAIARGICEGRGTDAQRLTRLTTVIRQRAGETVYRADGMLLETLERFFALIVTCSRHIGESVTAQETAAATPCSGDNVKPAAIDEMTLTPTTRADTECISGSCSHAAGMKESMVGSDTSNDCHAVACHYGDASDFAQSVDSALRLLPCLRGAYPMLPVERVALLQFLRAGFDAGAATVLRRAESPTVLRDIPLAALEALARRRDDAALRQTLADLRALSSATSEASSAAVVPSDGPPRGPWRCRHCRQWNRRRSVACECCAALALSVVRCGKCGGFSPTSALSCLVCGTPTQSITAGEADGEVSMDLCDGCTLIPLRAWRCPRCSRANEAHHVYYCATCSAVRPAMESALTRSAFNCVSCGRRNPLGLLRPWCAACGTLSATAAAGPPKTLWHCVECHTPCPWILTHCHACGAARGGGAEAPWRVQRCGECGGRGAAWGGTCPQCSAALPPRAPGHGAGPGAGVEAGPGDVVGEADKESGAEGRGGAATRVWVCLANDCLSANIDAGGEAPLRCRHCGTTHSAPAVAPEAGQTLRHSAAGEGGAGDARPTALLLTPLTAPRCCDACGAQLLPTNVVRLCPRCRHCSAASGGELAARAALKELCRVAPSCAPGDARALVAALCAAEEAQLPWRGRDLSRGMRCGVHTRVPVLRDGEVHGAMTEVACIVRTLAERAAADRGAWVDRRPFVAVALDLVDLMNRTTDYDEIGFDVLATLCEAVRPVQYAHIHRETRWAYLRYMKLPREWVVNDVVCPTCLWPKQRSDAMGDICHCGGASDATDATAHSRSGY